MNINLVQKLLQFILADAREYPEGEGSDEAIDEREVLAEIAENANKALEALSLGLGEKTVIEEFAKMVAELEKALAEAKAKLGRMRKEDRGE